MILPDFLSPKQIDQAFALYRQYQGSGQEAKKIAKDVIEPNMATINRKLGQENDARYLAHACVYVFAQMPK